MLGFFDSGLGGLTVLREVRRVQPELDLLYLGDQAHMPYGDRSPQDLQALFASNVRFLNESSVAGIVGIHGAERPPEWQPEPPRLST